MQTKIISLIIATYNAEATLERCLKSIISQKTHEIELLIIDGQSKDQTCNIIRKYSSYIDYFISEPDKGIYDAWNKGVKKSKGQWIMFLGADDILVPDCFSYYLSYINSNELSFIDIITAKANVVNHHQKLLYIYGEPYSWNIFKYRMNISHGSSLHNRELFQEIGYFDINLKICADYEFLLRKKMRTQYCDKVMIYMEYGGVSNTIKGVIDAYRARKKQRSIPTIINILVVIRGVLSFYLRKFNICFCKK